MKKLFIFYFVSFLAMFDVAAQEASTSPKLLSGQRRYDLIVEQDNEVLTFNRGIEEARARGQNLEHRGIFSDIAMAYSSLGTSLLINASQNLIGAGVSLITESIRDKRPDWESAAMGECTFIKHLPSQTEILDFYDSISTVGAMDPKGMKFSGFGCRQYITIIDPDGKPMNQDVFYVSCKLRNDPEGLDRIAHHSKFEIYVDSLCFNPYLCNLPNDTLSVDSATRIGFDFERRKDLEFKIVATIRSSWINEAIQLAKDVELGQFIITARIDSTSIKNNLFTYKHDNPADKGKVVSVIGDSFIVPRSYAGFSNDGFTQNWGTGQYRVDMDIIESCKINTSFYKDSSGKKDKWNKEWKKEWTKMKNRPKRVPSNNIVDIAFPQLSGNKWITTIIEPITTQIILYEGMYVNAASSILTSKLGSPNGQSSKGAASSASASSPANSYGAAQK